MKLLIFVFIFAVAFTSVFAQNKSNNSEATKQLYALFDSEWENNLRENPTFASSQGDRRYNDKWSEIALRRLKNKIKKRLPHLRKSKKLTVQNCPFPTNSITTCSKKITNKASKGTNLKAIYCR